MGALFNLMERMCGRPRRFDQRALLAQDVAGSAVRDEDCAAASRKPNNPTLSTSEQFKTRMVYFIAGFVLGNLCGILQMKASN
jgi:hypothetical protein